MRQRGSKESFRIQISAHPQVIFLLQIFLKNAWNCSSKGVPQLVISRPEIALQKKLKNVLE